MDKPADACPRCNIRCLRDFSSMNQQERNEFFDKFPELQPLKCSNGKCCSECGWVDGLDNRDTTRRGSRNKRRDGENKNPENSSLNQ